MGEREYASKQLLVFLGQVGPVEAQWAMQTALAALQDLPASEDHIAAVHQALEGNVSIVGFPQPASSNKANREAKGRAPA